MLKKILRRIFLFPLMAIVAIPTACVTYLLHLDNDFYEAKMTVFFFMDIGWNGVYEE